MISLSDFLKEREMLNWKILKRFLKIYCKYRWHKEHEWLNKMRPLILDDAKKFLSENNLLYESNMERLAEKWLDYVKMFNPDSPEEFYLGWKGERGASNIVANIFDQLSRPYIASALIEQLGYKFRGDILDFGCNTAAISLLWQRQIAKDSRLFLADVENLARDFVRYEIKKYTEYKTEIVDVNLENVKDNSLDCVLCIDVLEHLKNPSEVFALIDGKLKHWGILILQSPWGGHPEHLKEAPMDWNKRGGKKLLRSNYELIKRFIPFVLSGIYRKI